MASPESRAGWSILVISSDQPLRVARGSASSEPARRRLGAGKRASGSCHRGGRCCGLRAGGSRLRGPGFPPATRDSKLARACARRASEPGPRAGHWQRAGASPGPGSGWDPPPPALEYCQRRIGVNSPSGRGAHFDYNRVDNCSSRERITTTIARSHLPFRAGSAFRLQPRRQLRLSLR